MSTKSFFYTQSTEKAEYLAILKTKRPRLTSIQRGSRIFKNASFLFTPPKVSSLGGPQVGGLAPLMIHHPSIGLRG